MKRLLLLVLVLSIGFAQGINLTLNSSILNAKLNRLSINDFDFIGAGKTQTLFTGIMTIDVADQTDLDLQLFFKFTYNKRPVINTHTDIIRNVKSQTVTFSNTQISEDISVQTFDGQQNLKFDDISINPDAGLKLSATLADGSYHLEVTAKLSRKIGSAPREVVGEIGFSEKDFYLQQNWPVNLMNPVGEVNTSTPLFQWDSRATRYPKVTLYVWEDINGDQSASISQGVTPILKREFVNVDNMGIPASFAFPASNNRPLEDKKKYYWTARVSIVTAASSEPKEEPNEILEFTYKKPSNENIKATAIDNILRQVLGTTGFEIYQKEFGNCTFKSITFNGEEGEINNLTPYIQKLVNGDYNLLVETY
jgi:hypothetical protein